VKAHQDQGPARTKKKTPQANKPVRAGRKTAQREVRWGTKKGESLKGSGEKKNRISKYKKLLSTTSWGDPPTYTEGGGEDKQERQEKKKHLWKGPLGSKNKPGREAKKKTIKLL